MSSVAVVTLVLCRLRGKSHVNIAFFLLHVPALSVVARICHHSYIMFFPHQAWYSFTGVGQVRRDSPGTATVPSKCSKFAVRQPVRLTFYRKAPPSVPEVYTWHPLDLQLIDITTSRR
ncbi:uncharacterized protein BDW47DRAFT_109435 [Aspergillus candidus]|uniref:Uncharacterized protein n=1 Tax=Aspergillus candidus TaxID=41067 RepID=A0A2I2F665_ASPCN|nr:hypothetical protein BDW47DRAFT_109435 [Aspergillus candidus]PLB36076.1 hypothetical protein BDW47DRAFT_109435 [Aspergillus candidus]